MVVIRLPEVLRRIGISRSKLYADIKLGNFPPPISLGARAIGWIDADVDHWIANLATEKHNRIEASGAIA